MFSYQPYGQKSDIWALGCCVYEMTTLEHAFHAEDRNLLAQEIIRGQTPDVSSKYSQPLATMVASMLSKNPDLRPSAKTILQNPFIKQHIARLLAKTKNKCDTQKRSSLISPTSSSSRAKSAHANPEASESLSTSQMRHSQPNEAARSCSGTRHHALRRSTPLPEDDQQRRDESHTITQSPRIKSADRDPSPSHQGFLSDARRRRRDHRAHLSNSGDQSTLSASANQTESSETDSSHLRVHQADAVGRESRKESDKDMSDLLLMLTAALHLASPATSKASDPQNLASFTGMPHGRTMATPLQETSRLYQRCQTLRTACLEEMTVVQLRTALEILENLSGTQMLNSLMLELGDYLYDKYSANIFLLRFYEHDLLIRP